MICIGDATFVIYCMVSLSDSQQKQTYLSCLLIEKNYWCDRNGMKNRPQISQLKVVQFINTCETKYK